MFFGVSYAVARSFKMILLMFKMKNNAKYIKLCDLPNLQNRIEVIKNFCIRVFVWSRYFWFAFSKKIKVLIF